MPFFVAIFIPLLVQVGRPIVRVTGNELGVDDYRSNPSFFGSRHERTERYIWANHNATPDWRVGSFQRDLELMVAEPFGDFGPDCFGSLLRIDVDHELSVLNGYVAQDRVVP